MTIALNVFYRGLLCDKALLQALEYVKLGKQYVFKTKEACSGEHIRVMEQVLLTDREK